MKTRIFRLLAVAALTAGCAVSAASAAEEPMKVGFIYVGPVGDHGWSYEHDRARKELEKAMPGQIKTTFVENVAEGADAERVITQLAKGGNKIIFTTSFGFMNPTLKVAKKFPNVIFEHATGYKRTKNVSTYIQRAYEGRYVAGVAAGLLTKSNTIGYIASFPIPEVYRDIDATFMGAKSVNPNVKIKIVWVNSWYDPGKETDAANTLIDQGVDVLMQHTDSPAPMLVAEKRGVRAVGQASDVSHFGPKAHVFSIVDNWEPHYLKTVQAVKDGSWKPQDYWGGFAEDVVKLGSINDNLPQNVKDAINTTYTKIKTGEFKPFTGPLKDNTGKEVVAAGHSMTDAELAQINWFVEGIDATVAK